MICECIKQSLFESHVQYVTLEFQIPIYIVNLVNQNLCTLHHDATFTQYNLNSVLFSTEIHAFLQEPNDTIESPCNFSEDQAEEKS